MTSAPPGAAPVLHARGARIAVDDVVALDRLSISTVGDRVLCGGDVAPLFGVLCGVHLRTPGDDDELVRAGDARLVAGELSLGGVSVAHRGHLAIAGAAPLDPRLPGAWSAEEYVTWGARLGGASRRAARDLARDALEKVGLGTARARSISSLALPERRALVLGQAIATAPRVLVAEAPLSGLDGAGAAFVGAALAAATDGRGAVVSVSRLDPGTAEGALARAATFVLVFAAGELALEGPAAEVFSGARIYGLSVRANAEPLRDELSARGIALRGGPLRFTAALPPGAGTRDILAAAAAVRASVVEMIPLV